MPNAVACEVMEGIALVTFNLPTRNVATAATWDALTTALAGYAGEAAVRVLVLTGAGHHAFVTDPAAAAMEQQAIHDTAACRAQVALAAFPKPTIARVRGDCIGAGLLLALHADMIVAAWDSAFCLPGARWGACYPPGAVARLAALIGPQHAKRLLFSGGRIAAREALDIGLVTVLCADADLSDTVVDLARAIADNAPLAVAAAKRMVDAAEGPALEALVAQCRASADYAAALSAMPRGKAPAFQGR